MGFLNAMLLLGSAAFVVPLGIHLLNRARFQSVDWAAMHLLDVSDQQNARQIEWRSLLLLLLRCLIPVVLAVCMARPLVQTAAVGGTGGRSTTALLLDTSFSMQGQAGDGDGETRGWEQAEATASRIVDGLAGQAELAVVALGGEATRAGDVVRRDPRPALGAIARLTASAVSLDAAGGLRLAEQTLDASREPHRQLVLVSDFQQRDWSESVEAAVTAIRRGWEDAAVRPELHLIPVPVSPQANVSASFDAIANEVTLLGEPVDLQISLENHGSQPVVAVPMRFSVDGRELMSRKVDLPAAGRSQLGLTVDFEKPGTHQALVEIDDPAGWITADDADSLQLQTLPTRRVLMIEQDPRPALFDCETGYLQLALESSARDAGEGQAAVVRRTSVAELREAMVTESDVVVLADVPQLPDDAVGWLAARVASGGLLCVFAGEGLDPAWYERAVGPASPHPLLPWRYGETAATTDGGEAGEAKDAGSETFRSGPSPDPLLAFFDDPQHGRLDAVRLDAWRTLEPWAEDRPAEVLLTAEHGQPMLVAAAFGEGRVLQWALAADEASGSLPLEPVFVPLMQRLLLLDLSRATPRRPDDRRQESSLAPLTAAEQTTLAQRLGATLHASAEAFLAHDRNRRGGQEVWRWLLAVVVALLFAEMLLAGRLTRRGGR